MTVTSGQRDRRPLFVLMIAYVVSIAGNQLALLALPWYVLQTTGSAGRVGIAGAAEAIGVILSAFFGGVLVDRIGFRRSSILADCASAVAIVLIPLLDRAVGLAFWQLLLLIFLVSVVNEPGTTARNGILPDLAELAELTLERATSIQQSAVNVASLVGPLIAGVLIATISARNVLWVDGATFAFSAVVMALFVPRSITSTTEDEEDVPYLTALRDGLRFITSERVVRSLGLLAAYVDSVGAAFMSFLLPVMAKRVFGSSVDFGLLIAADGGGALLGNFVFGLWGERWPRRPTMALAFAISFADLAVIAVLPGLVITITMLFIGGAMFGIIGPLIFTVYQERTPAELRGRVFGTLSGLQELGVPVGVVLAGFAIQVFSIRATLAAVAILSLAMPLALVIAPSFRPMDQVSVPIEDVALGEID